MASKNDPVEQFLNDYQSASDFTGKAVYADLKAKLRPLRSKDTALSLPAWLDLITTLTTRTGSDLGFLNTDPQVKICTDLLPDGLPDDPTDKRLRRQIQRIQAAAATVCGMIQRGHRGYRIADFPARPLDFAISQTFTPAGINRAALEAAKTVWSRAAADLRTRWDTFRRRLSQQVPLPQAAEGIFETPPPAPTPDGLRNWTPTQRRVWSAYRLAIENLKISPGRKGSGKAAFDWLCEKYPEEYGRRGMAYHTFKKHLAAVRKKDPRTPTDPVDFADWEQISHRYTQE